MRGGEGGFVAATIPSQHRPEIAWEEDAMPLGPLFARAVARDPPPDFRRLQEQPLSLPPVVARTIAGSYARKDDSWFNN